MKEKKKKKDRRKKDYRKDSLDALKQRMAEAWRAKEIKDKKIPNKGDYKNLDRQIPQR